MGSDPEQSSKKARLDPLPPGISLADLPDEIILKIFQHTGVAKATGSVCQKFETLRMHSAIELFSIITTERQFHAYLTNQQPYKLNKLLIRFPIDRAYATMLSCDIEKRTALTHLLLNNTNIGNFGFGYLLGILENLTFFKQLRFANNPLSPDGKAFVSKKFKIIF